MPKSREHRRRGPLPHLVQRQTPRYTRKFLRGYDLVERSEDLYHRRKDYRHRRQSGRERVRAVNRRVYGQPRAPFRGFRPLMGGRGRGRR